MFPGSPGVFKGSKEHTCSDDAITTPQQEQMLGCAALTLVQPPPQTEEVVLCTRKKTPGGAGTQRLFPVKTRRSVRRRESYRFFLSVSL